jgi:hypothetical protein
MALDPVQGLNGALAPHPRDKRSRPRDTADERWSESAATAAMRVQTTERRPAAVDGRA